MLTNDELRRDMVISRSGMSSTMRAKFRGKDHLAWEVSLILTLASQQIKIPNLLLGSRWAGALIQELQPPSKVFAIFPLYHHVNLPQKQWQYEFCGRNRTSWILLADYTLKSCKVT